MIRDIIKHFQRRYWHLGFSNYNAGFITGKVKLRVKYMKGLPKNKWYADPFILDVSNSTIEVLVEEFTYDIKRGRIARLSIDKKTLRLLSEKIILDLPTHLSFPAILRENNYIYIYPENSAAKANTLYKYNVTNNQLETMWVTVNEPLTDAVIFHWQGQKYMFATRIPEDNSNHLLIFKEKDNNCFELCQEHYFDDKIARNAGDVLFLGNKCYRVAQDCSKGYGGGVIFQEIGMENGLFTFKSINEIYPYSNSFALHTFNTYKDLCVIDVSKARYPIVNSILSFFSNIIR